MKHEDITDYYIIIRMWSPFEKGTFYACNELVEGKGLTWDVCDDSWDAAIFKSESIAKRVVKCIPVLRQKFAEGWIYEIVKVSEETLETNDPAEKEKAA